jgi:4-amino-4-deoxy-L-arabinose transferase-like glycosyltransferase
MNTKLILVLIVIFGFFLRVVVLGQYPPSLNWDEISHGYNAYSILTTGKDEWGQTLPLTNFRAYGDYPLPLNLYLTAPFIAILGLNEFSIRLPHAILGALTILSVYFLALGVSKNKKLSLFAAFLCAVSPWYLFTSRFVLQSNLSVFLLITGMALFFNRQKSIWFLPLSFATLGLTLFSYHSTRIFTPLLVIAILIIYWREFVSIYKKQKRVFVSLLVILLIFFAPLPLILSNPEARARSNEVFLVNQGVVNKIIDARNNSDLPQMVERLIYNRPVYFAKDFFKNYIGYFSPQFLFLQGGTQYQFSLPNHGLFFVVNLPLFYLGLVVLVKKAIVKQKEIFRKDYLLLLTWLIFAPIVASITTEQFAVLRSTPLLPLPELLIAFGAFALLGFLSKRKIDSTLLVISYFVLTFVLLSNYLLNYFTVYPKDYSWAWQYGYKEAVNYAKSKYEDYDQIIISKKYGEPHEYVLFYNQWDSNKYQNDPNLIRFNQSNWWWVDSFDKYNFVNDWQVKDLTLESGGKVDCNSKKCLLITSPGNYPDGWSKLNSINFLDGKPAFETYEN